MRFTILKVTAAHIARGRPISFSYGPIAYAIRERMRDGTLVQVIHGSIFICRSGQRFWLDLPPAALLFCRRFNAHQAVEPFAFRVALPADLLVRVATAVKRRPPEIAKVSHGRNRRSAA